MPGKFQLLQSSVRPEFHSQIDLIAARRIIAMHLHGGIDEVSKIPRFSRMIENHFLIQFFELRVHEKKRTAPRRISIMRSISAVVL